MCVVERLFSSSLVALVELSNPRKLRVCHFKVHKCHFHKSHHFCIVNGAEWWS